MFNSSMVLRSGDSARRDKEVFGGTPVLLRVLGVIGQRLVVYY
jgi:hypothetical protein